MAEGTLLQNVLPESPPEDRQCLSAMSSERNFAPRLLSGPSRLRNMMRQKNAELRKTLNREPSIQHTHKACLPASCFHSFQTPSFIRLSIIKDTVNLPKYRTEKSKCSEMHEFVYEQHNSPVSGAKTPFINNLRAFASII